MVNKGKFLKDSNGDWFNMKNCSQEINDTERKFLHHLNNNPFNLIFKAIKKEYLEFFDQKLIKTMKNNNKIFFIKKTYRVTRLPQLKEQNSNILKDIQKYLESTINFNKLLLDDKIYQEFLSENLINLLQQNVNNSLLIPIDNNLNILFKQGNYSTLEFLYSLENFHKFNKELLSKFFQK